ncbi:MAG: helix-turn-helix transcriptional regulator [Chloroflexi bacterium]|nr:helix-turn-helix transcriptional regulator [Chloroflexota bacterium]
MALGQTIRSHREELGMSQARLATAAGLSQGYLSQIENGEVSNPSAAVLFRLAQSLHVDPRVLLEAAGYEQPRERNGEEEFDMPVDPDLLRFLASQSREQQRALLRLLQEIEDKLAVAEGQRR